MDLAKSIPQMFFDLIARIVPALLFFWGVALASGTELPPRVPGISATKSAGVGGTALEIAVALATLYVAGQLLDLVARWWTHLWFHWHEAPARWSTPRWPG